MRRPSYLSILVLLVALVGCNDGGGDKPDAGVHVDSKPTGDSTIQPDGAVAADPCARVEAERFTCTQVLQERFTQDTTIAKGCYLVEKNPIVSDGVTLTIAAGVTLIFSEEKKLEVNGTQSLVAVGTPTEQICLTGKQRTRGYWAGVRFSGTSEVKNKLDYVTVEYAGSTTADGNTSAGVRAWADSRGATLSVSHTTVRESKAWGIYLVGSSKVGAFAANSLTKCTLGPISLDTEVVRHLDTASTYTGNDVDQINVFGSYVDTASTWNALGVPYFISFMIEVRNELTIAAGVTLIMNANGAIRVSGDAPAFIAAGTSDKPVVITGKEKTRGYWGSISFTNAGNTKNSLEHVTVEYAGSMVGQDDYAAVMLGSTGNATRVSLSHCTLRESKARGLQFDGNVTLPTFANNTITLNTKGPVKAAATKVHQLTNSSTYTGNTVDQIDVMAYSLGDTAVTWHDIGVPYVLDQGLRIQNHWTLEPGVTVVLPENAEISTNSDAAYITADGTAAKPITFTGDKTKPWVAITLGHTHNAWSFQHVVVENGGKIGYQPKAEIFAAPGSEGVSLTVKDSIIRNSAQYGIWVDKSTNVNADIATSNTFTGNASGGYFKEP